MEVPESIKEIYSYFNEEEVKKIKEFYYYDVKRVLNEWKVKFENGLVDDSEKEKFIKILKNEIVYLSNYIYNGAKYFNKDKPNIVMATNNKMRFVVFFDYWELYEKYVKEENEDKITEITEPLTSTQKDKIGLFVRSGIIQFLRDKNPNISDRELAKFIIELVSCEKMTNAESLKPHLTKNIHSEKHPFYKTGKREEYDLILNKYGIKPQADQ